MQLGKFGELLGDRRTARWGTLLDNHGWPSGLGNLSPELVQAVLCSCIGRSVQGEGVGESEGPLLSAFRLRVVPRQKSLLAVPW